MMTDDRPTNYSDVACPLCMALPGDPCTDDDGQPLLLSSGKSAAVHGARMAAYYPPRQQFAQALLFRQDDGLVLIEAEAAHTVIGTRDLISLLSVVVAAIRVDGDHEQIDLARKVVAASLGGMR
jgi:hypothetical protein